MSGPTCQDPAGDPRNTLYLSHIVGSKVGVAGCVEEGRITENAPQLGGRCAISRLNGLGANIKGLPHQSAVPQDTHTGENARPKCHNNIHDISYSA